MITPEVSISIILLGKDLVFTYNQEGQPFRLLNDQFI